MRESKTERRGGGWNRKSREEHLRDGTYRADRHGQLGPQVCRSRNRPGNPFPNKGTNVKRSIRTLDQHPPHAAAEQKLRDLWATRAALDAEALQIQTALRNRPSQNDQVLAEAERLAGCDDGNKGPTTGQLRERLTKVYFERDAHAEAVELCKRRLKEIGTDASKVICRDVFAEWTEAATKVAVLARELIAAFAVEQKIRDDLRCAGVAIMPPTSDCAAAHESLTHRLGVLADLIDEAKAAGGQ